MAWQGMGWALDHEVSPFDPAQLGNSSLFSSLFFFFTDAVLTWSTTNRMESPPASQSSQVYIRLDADVPVHQVIMRASQLSKEQNQSIKGLLFRAKQAYLPDNEEITDAQLRKFNTEYVYAKGWIPGRRHPPPADQPTMSNKLDIAVQVGILLEDCRATPAQAGAPKSRTRANRKKFKKEAPPTTNPHRKKNSPIFFMISDYVKGNKTYHQVSFRDEKCQFLPRDIKFSTVHEYVDDLEDAYIQTLEKWDNFV